MIKRIALLTAFAVLAFNAPAMAACDDPCNPGGGSCPGGNQIACDDDDHNGNGHGGKIACDDNGNGNGGGSCPGGDKIACDDDNTCPGGNGPKPLA